MLALKLTPTTCITYQVKSNNGNSTKHNNTGNVRINVTMMRIISTIVAVEKQ